MKSIIIGPDGRVSTILTGQDMKDAEDRMREDENDRQMESERRWIDEHNRRVQEEKEADIRTLYDFYIRGCPEKCEFYRNKLIRYETIKSLSIDEFGKDGHLALKKEDHDFIKKYEADKKKEAEAKREREVRNERCRSEHLQKKINKENRKYLIQFLGFIAFLIIFTSLITFISGFWLLVYIPTTVYILFRMDENGTNYLKWYCILSPLPILTLIASAFFS